MWCSQCLCCSCWYRASDDWTCHPLRGSNLPLPCSSSFSARTGCCKNEALLMQIMLLWLCWGNFLVSGVRFVAKLKQKGFSDMISVYMSFLASMKAECRCTGSAAVPPWAVCGYSTCIWCDLCRGHLQGLSKPYSSSLTCTGFV